MLSYYLLSCAMLRVRRGLLDVASTRPVQRWCRFLMRHTVAHRFHCLRPWQVSLLSRFSDVDSIDVLQTSSRELDHHRPTLPCVLPMCVPFTVNLSPRVPEASNHRRARLALETFVLCRWHRVNRRVLRRRGYTTAKDHDQQKYGLLASHCLPLGTSVYMLSG